jgi:hypothetical protein
MSDGLRMEQALKEALEDQHYATDMLHNTVHALRQERDQLKHAIARENHDITQTLGKALGYPWFKDDLKNFPDATEADGVCVGDHVAASLASEAAAKINQLRAEVEELRKDKARLDWLEKGDCHSYEWRYGCDSPCIVRATDGEEFFVGELGLRHAIDAAMKEETR